MRPSNRTSRFTLAGVTILLAALTVALIYVRSRTPAPNVPIPKDLEKLEPQLRDYLSQQLKWVQKKPRRSDRHATLGLIYAVNGLWFEAHQAFQNAASLDPDEPLAWMYIGVAAHELGDTKEAIKNFRDLTSRFPNFAAGFYRLGYELLRTGDGDGAEKAYTRLTVLAPKEWRGYAGFGETMIRRGQYSAAVQSLEKAIQLDSTVKIVHHLLGQAYQGLGRPEEAELELQLGRNASDSPMPDAWAKTASQHIRVLQEQMQLASDYLDSGEPQKAVEILATAIAYHPDNLGLMNQLAIALNQSNQPDKAGAVLKRALEKDGRFVPALITLALCQQKLNKNEESLATAERAITLAPDITQGYTAKANALLAMERDDEALVALENAAHHDPQNAEILMEMGDVLWRNLNRPAEAMDRYEAARRLNPVLAPVYVRLADLNLERREIDAARTCIAKLRRLSPNLPDLAVLEQRLRKLDSR